jgi:hypothetical protein
LFGSANHVLNRDRIRNVCWNANGIAPFGRQRRDHRSQILNSTGGDCHAHSPTGEGERERLPQPSTAASDECYLVHFVRLSQPVPMAAQRILNSMSNRWKIERALEYFADPLKREQYFQLYSDDVILHGYQGVEPGLDNVKQFYRRFWDSFPDAQVTAQEIIEQGEVLVVRH